MKTLLIAIALVPASLAAQNPLAPAADRFPGVFSNDQLKVEIRGGGGQYTGTLHFQGQALPLTARRLGGGMEGTFQSQGQSFAFKAALEGDILTLTTDGASYSLRREAGANPLASPRPATAAAAASGKLHQNPAGVLFRIPEDWQVEHAGELSVIVPAGVTIDPNGDNNPEIYMVGINSEIRDVNDPRLVESTQSEFGENVKLERAVEKEPFTAAKGPGMMFTWDFRNPQGQRMRLRIHAVVVNNQGLVLTALGHRERLESRQTAVRQVASSLDFGGPQAPATTSQSTPSSKPAPVPAPSGPNIQTDTPLARQWDQRLRGKMLTQMSGNVGSSGGYTSSKKIYLNADGTFHYSSSSLVTVDVGGAFGNSGGSETGKGWWRVITSQNTPNLELRAEGEETVYVPLTDQDGKTFLGATRFFVTDPK